MHVADKIGTRKIEDFRTVLLSPVILLHLQIGALNLRAHGAVEEEDVGIEEFEEMRHYYFQKGDIF